LVLLGCFNCEAAYFFTQIENWKRYHRHCTITAG
jgi:hypothetical protein